MKMTVGNETAMHEAYAKHEKAAGPEVCKFWVMVRKSNELRRGGWQNTKK